jgi:hypothetical protein
MNQMPTDSHQHGPAAPDDSAAEGRIDLMSNCQHAETSAGLSLEWLLDRSRTAREPRT